MQEGSCFPTEGCSGNNDEELTRLLRQCGRFLFYQSACGQSQGRILHMLAEGPLTQKEIQDRLDVKASSVSELITKLESKSLVERCTCQKDRRVVEIHLTEKGKSALPLSPIVPLQNLYSPLSEEQKQTLGELLSGLLEEWKSKAESELSQPGNFAEKASLDGKTESPCSKMESLCSKTACSKTESGVNDQKNQEVLQ